MKYFIIILVIAFLSLFMISCQNKTTNSYIHFKNGLAYKNIDGVDKLYSGITNISTTKEIEYFEGKRVRKPYYPKWRRILATIILILGGFLDFKELIFIFFED